MGSDAKEMVRREGRSLELPSKRGLRVLLMILLDMVGRNR